MTGIVGVISGAGISRRCKKINAKADPLICAVGMFSSAPCLYLSIMLAAQSVVATYVSVDKLCGLDKWLCSIAWVVCRV